MQFFYFTKKQYGLAAIRDERLKISQYSSLNDPFDFIGIATDSSADREALKKKRDELSQKQGIVCFSDRWKEPLMWGHYADAHKGMCLGFSVNRSKFDKMEYVAERPKLADFDRPSVSRLTQSDIREISMKKFTRWSYESEWRRVVALENQDFVDNNYFLPFDEHMRLRTVLFGERCDVTDKQISGIIKAAPYVKIGFTRAAYKRFDVILDQTGESLRVPKEHRAFLRFNSGVLAQLRYNQNKRMDPIFKDPEEQEDDD